ncbi:hypothetical protein ANO11243_021540 [Dothideomycetidae sp. 11243]|nr:hypothetical protein ANO11243_021540 [fungal sp. No.11243]
MRFSFLTTAVVVLAAEGVVGSSWFTKILTSHLLAYNKWHETELERWLSDHNIPYPTPADRKDLVDLVKNSWEENQVQQTWTETTDQASDAYGSTQDWVFDRYDISCLFSVKSFLDYHGIPNPTPRTRDSLLQTARSNYQSIANKVGETAAYPGDWLYQSWSESDLKAWMDERGIPAPQPSSRDKLIASVRRNGRLSSNRASEALSSVSSAAASATQALTDELLNSWSESQLKQWADENGVPVPQGSKKNELLALVRKHRSRASASAASAFGAATTSAGNAYAQATNDLYDQGKQWYDWAMVQIGIGSEEANGEPGRSEVGAALMVDLLLNWCRIAVGGPRWSYDDCMGYGFGRTGREIRLSARRNDRSARDAHVLGPDQLELSGGACGVSRLLGPRSRSMLSSVMLPASETAEVRESVSVVSAWYEKRMQLLSTHLPEVLGTQVEVVFVLDVASALSGWGEDHDGWISLSGCCAVGESEASSTPGPAWRGMSWAMASPDGGHMEGFWTSSEGTERVLGVTKRTRE